VRDCSYTGIVQIRKDGPNVTSILSDVPSEIIKVTLTTRMVNGITKFAIHTKDNPQLAFIAPAIRPLLYEHTHFTLIMVKGED
jgi:hypothetical protein